MKFTVQLTPDRTRITPCRIRQGHVHHAFMDTAVTAADPPLDPLLLLRTAAAVMRTGMQCHHAAYIVPFTLTAFQHRTDGRGHLIAQKQEQRRVMDTAAPIPLIMLCFLLGSVLLSIL